MEIAVSCEMRAAGVCVCLCVCVCVDSFSIWRLWFPARRESCPCNLTLCRTHTHKRVCQELDIVAFFESDSRLVLMQYAFILRNSKD